MGGSGQEYGWGGGDGGGGGSSHLNRILRPTCGEIMNNMKIKKPQEEIEPCWHVKGFLFSAQLR